MLLKELGFNEKEVKVYLTIIKYGKIKPVEVAKITNINRTTVYSTVKKLIKKGLILEDYSKSTNHLVARLPQDLVTLARKEEKQLEQKKAIIKQTIDQLSILAEENKYSIPKITLITEENLLDYLYKQTNKWNYSVLDIDKTWWGFQDSAFVKQFKQWIDWSWQQESSNEITVKLLSSSLDIEKQMSLNNYKRKIIKLWNKSGSFSASTWIIGHYIIMVNTTSKPFYLIEIFNAPMASNLREIFKAIWQTI